MASSSSTTLEDEIRELLDETRRKAHQYASAHYRDPNRPGNDGLDMRLTAIEEGLLCLAAAIDRR